MANLSTRFDNLLLDTDSYKTSHYRQYPEQTQYISSYIEPRGGQFADTVFFGLQAYLLENLTRPFTQADIDEAELILSSHGVPFNRAGWQYILDTYQGYLPVEIQAVPEGTVIGCKNAVVQIINTDPACCWLVSYLETALLRAVWYPSTVASLSYACRQMIKAAMQKSCDSLDGLPFKLHDFGARGVSSRESAALGGLGHLVNFAGTDTVSALIGAARWYGMNTPEKMAGFSIPAAEHSTITSWGREGEANAYRNMLAQFGGAGKIVAVVSDSYDLWNAIDNLWGGELREAVLQNGGTLVIRPDSGDPVKVVREALERLAVRFGTRTNPKGLAFGMGGGLLQQVDRDTLGWAMKASAAQVDGVWRDVYKDPITSRAKRSKKGRLAVVADGAGYQTIRLDELAGRPNLLRPVFRNGQLLAQDDLLSIRQRVGW